MLSGRLLCLFLLLSLVTCVCFSVEVSAKAGNYVGFDAGGLFAQPAGTASPPPSGVLSYNYSVTILGHTYTIKAQTNSELSNFEMTSDGMGIQFHAVVPEGLEGFCDFTIPTSLLGGNLAVLVDGSPLVEGVNYTRSTEGSDYLFHLTYGNGERSIAVTSAVVETPLLTPTSTLQSTSPKQSAAPTPTQSPQAPSNETAWVPKTQDAIIATVAATATVGAVAAVFSTVTSSVTDQIVDAASKKGKDVATAGFKKWLERYVMSKRKMSANANRSKIWFVVKPEILSYGVTIPVMTFAFLYVQKGTFEEFLLFLPTILSVSVMVYFVRTFAFIVASRKEGAWIENRLWYLGLGTLVITTLVIKVPLLTSSQNVFCGECSKSLKGIAATAEILVTLAFGGLFYFIMQNYSTFIGGTGLAMCLTAAFFNAYPLSPMKGKDVFTYSKALWAGVFALSIAAYIYWLLFI
jgi:hypothetical protein